MPEVAVAVVGTALTGFVAGASTTLIIATSIIAAATTILSMALAPRQKRAAAPPPEMAIRQPVPVGRLVYGRARVGGDLALFHRGEIPPVAANSYDRRKNLHLIVVLAVHEIQGVVSIYDGENLLWSAAEGIASAYSDKVVNVVVRKGADNQTAIAGLVTALPDTLAGAKGQNFRLRGSAYVWIELLDVQSKWAGGLPAIWAEIDGALVYDPRSNARGFSANAALCAADYLTRDRGGVGLAWSDVDQDALSVAANICDENVTVAAGGSIARYEINGVIMSDAVPRDVLNSISVQFGGQIVERGGMFVVQAGAYVSPVAAITPGDMMGALKVSRAVDIEAIPNGVGGTYTSAPAQYVPDGLPVTIFSDYDAQDGAARIMDLNFERETNAERAQRCAVIAARRARRVVGVSIEVSPRFAILEAGDTVTIDLPQAGINQGVFEVVQARWMHTPGRAVVGLQLVETSAAVFAWQASDALGTVEAAPSGAPSAATVAPVSAVTLTAQTRIAGDGATVSALVVAWTASPDFWLSRYLIRWTPAGGQTREAVAPASATSFEILGAVAGVAVVASVVAVNIFGRDSAGGAPAGAVAPVLDTTPPGVPSAVSAIGSVDKIVLSWVSPTDADLAGIIVEAGSSSVYANAVEVWRGLATSYEHPGEGVGVVRWFWVRSIDRTGNKSSVSASVNSSPLGVVANDIANEAISTPKIDQVAVSNGIFSYPPVTPITANWTNLEVLTLTATEEMYFIEGAYDAGTSTGTFSFTGSSGSSAYVAMNTRMILRDIDSGVDVEKIEMETERITMTTSQVIVDFPNVRRHVGAQGLEIVPGNRYRLSVQVKYLKSSNAFNVNLYTKQSSRIFLKGFKR
jgi:hypothetical protein